MLESNLSAATGGHTERQVTLTLPSHFLPLRGAGAEPPQFASCFALQTFFEPVTLPGNIYYFVNGSFRRLGDKGRFWQANR